MTAERWGYYYDGGRVRGVYPSMVAAIEAAVADAFDAGGDLRRLRVGRMITPRASEYLDRMDDDERDVGGRKGRHGEAPRLGVAMAMAEDTTTEERAGVAPGHGWTPHEEAENEKPHPERVGREDEP